ncbi:BnaAnng40460D [Brassica napus]|uniref:BnaAnng40460D protein n=2 Tax=Brassica napus TaxID=3708 RepID=A0A078JXC4_BRANA|nr:BnaAnng40460D [Brassica napus]
MSSAVSSVSEAATTVTSKLAKSPEAKNRMESSQEKLMNTYKELEEVNSKIVSENKGKTVSSAQKSELKQILSKWEQVTTQFVENLVSSSSSSSSSSQSQQSQQSQKSHQSEQSQQGSTMKTETN